MTTEPESFPRRHARTQRFTLGAPRSFTVAPDGTRVVFLRSSSGTERAGALWVLDPADGVERPAADPVALLGGADEDLPPEERARRERTREGGAGIVGYATDAAVELASFALSGRLFTAELRAGTARELPVAGPVVDPRPSPDGRHVAYVARGALRVVGAEGGDDRALAEPEGEGITYGLAEFIAAEEMARHRGFWWAPESDRLLVARVDDTPVRRWWIADPARPEREPHHVAYPAAGTPNAEVRLFVVGLDGVRTEVSWDRARYPYLARVHWSEGVRRCSWCRRGTSAASCTWRWTRTRGRPGWCMPTKIRFGWIFSPVCRAGRPRDSSSGSRTKAARASSPWANGP
ncbi:hypothetical protein GCM10020256_25520 [Streptomyces thermocoprophilus]